jgi:thymidine phosphorylase
MVRAQGGDDSWVADVASTAGRHVAKFTYAVRSPRDGFISGFSPCCEIGMVAVGLGAGRLLASDNVDPAAGVYMYVLLYTPLSVAKINHHRFHVNRHHKIGARVTKGTEIATLYSNISSEVCERAARRLLDCVLFADSEESVIVPQLIRCVVDKNGVSDWKGY